MLKLPVPTKGRAFSFLSLAGITAHETEILPLMVVAGAMVHPPQSESE